MLDIVAWHGRTHADHKQQMDNYSAKGYRTLSLSIYNTTDNPLYACVVIKRQVVIEEHQFVGLNATDFQQTFDKMSALGMGPNIVSAVGPRNAPLFAASFIPVTPTPLTRYPLSAAEFTALNQKQITAGQKLLWFDCYGSSGDETYIAVWWPDPEMMAWNCDGVGESKTLAHERYEGLDHTWARCAQIMVTPGGNVTSLYTDGTVGVSDTRFDLSADDYQTLFNDMRSKGLAPLRVCVQGSGGGANFGVVFGQTEETNPRIWRTTGSQTVAGVDAAIETYMKAAGVRDTSLAIVQGSRLVYAKGYTLAEPNYVDVQPTTLFRLGSCSKVFTAYALYVLLQQQLAKIPASQRPTMAAFMSTTTLQSVLHLTQPNGSPPADPKFAKITLLDLMTSTSGLDQGLIWSSVAAAGGTLPATRLQLAQYGATQTFKATPGDPKNVVYGNFDYFLLGEVVRTLSGETSYEAAVEKLIVQPLRQTRVRGARSLLVDQLPDEAAYHSTQPRPGFDSPLAVSPSVRTSARPLVANQYGGFDAEILGSCGGLSVAAVDLARLAASLNAPTNNPALTADTIDQWMNNAKQATATLTGPGDPHGYHGWDYVHPAGTDGFAGYKGGSLLGTGTEFYYTTGGLCYVFLLGANSRPGNTVGWRDALFGAGDAAAKAHVWDSTDLFPQYGMPSFTT
jgi:CubicO group peptidase (beta-lactamase class C family)